MQNEGASLTGVEFLSFEFQPLEVDLHLHSAHARHSRFNFCMSFIPADAALPGRVHVMCRPLHLTLLEFTIPSASCLETYCSESVRVSSLERCCGLLRCCTHTQIAT